jgi:hypothetical protein
MDKRSKVNSQLSDKVYDVTLDDVEPADFEFTSDLYKVNVFGKNVHIAPGRPKKDKTYTGLTYFYVYVIKDETAISKLGVYEKMTTENREIYDLTEFPDGSLLLFDVFYNMPALVDAFETDEVIEEPNEEKLVTIEGKRYKVKGDEVFDLTGKKVGNTIMNGTEVNWTWEKTESPSPNYAAPSKINYGAKMALNELAVNELALNEFAENESPQGINIFDYLKQNISKLSKKITQEAQNKKTILMRIKLRENSTIEPSKKEQYLLLLNSMTQNKLSIFDNAFIDNIKSVTNNGVLSYEEQIMFILYALGSYINVMFEFKNKTNEDIDDSEIKELGYIKSSPTIIIVQIKDKNAFFVEKTGTSLNQPMVKQSEPKATVPKQSEPKQSEPVIIAPNVALNEPYQPKSVNLNEPSPPFVVNEPSPPFIVNEPSPPFIVNEQQNVNLNEPPKMSGGKIKRGGNNIKLK